MLSALHFHVIRKEIRLRKGFFSTHWLFIVVASFEGTHFCNWKVVENEFKEEHWMPLTGVTVCVVRMAKARVLSIDKQNGFALLFPEFPSLSK